MPFQGTSFIALNYHHSSPTQGFYIVVERICCLCSIDKVPQVQSPVLVIHGTDDEVIDFSHGLAIYDKCPRAVEPLWVEVSITSKSNIQNQI